MREFRTSGSVGAPVSNRRGDPTTLRVETERERECSTFPFFELTSVSYRRDVRISDEINVRI